MIQLVYVSAAKAPFTPETLRHLLARAQVTNTALGVSGMLLHVDGAFLQVLEGAPEVVHPLFDKIDADPRHSKVLRLVTREIETRNFPDWSMGFFDGSGRASGLLGYRASNGFADLLGDADTVLRVIQGFRAGRWRSLAA